MRLFKYSGFVGWLYSAALGHAALIVPQSVVGLTQSATLIVVGAATIAPGPGAPGTLSLQIDRVVKGDSALAGTSITVGWTPGHSGPEGAAPQIGLWFVQRSSTGWLLLPVVRGDVPLSMTCFPTSSTTSITGVYAYGAAASISDKVASELSSAIESAPDASNFQLASLQYGALEELDSPVIPTLYARLSGSGNPQQRALGLSGLIRLGNSAALISASSGQFAAYPREYGIVLLSIRDRFRPTDRASVGALGAIAVNASIEAGFREAATHALAAIHTSDSLPYFASLLHDGDDTLRMEAIGGFSAFANGLPIQTAAGVSALSHLQLPVSSPYQTSETIANFAMGSQAISQKESQYLAFWENWWAQQHARLGY